jgi:hypothetical protein
MTETKYKVGTSWTNFDGKIKLEIISEPDRLNQVACKWFLESEKFQYVIYDLIEFEKQFSTEWREPVKWSGECRIHSLTKKNDTAWKFTQAIFEGFSDDSFYNLPIGMRVKLTVEELPK